MLIRTLTLMLVMWPALTMAATPLESLDFSSMLSQDATVARARKEGLSSGITRKIQNPQVPNARRIALIDAIVRSGRTPNLSRLYVRHLELSHRVSPGELTIAKLKTHEALALACMIARERPAKLARLGGDSEVERADPLLLINAAASRHRGDMTIALVNGLLKAHQATVTPKRALCDPHACVDRALAPFGNTWSVPKAFVCETLRAFPTPDGATVTAHRNTCGLKPQGAEAQPRIVQAPRAPKPTNHSRFTTPTRQSTTPSGLPPSLLRNPAQGLGLPRLIRMPNGQIMLPPGFKLPPGLMPSGFRIPANGQLSLQQSAALLKELRRLQAHRLRVQKNSRAARNIRANPKVIVVDPSKNPGPTKVKLIDGSSGSKGPNKLVLP